MARTPSFLQRLFRSRSGQDSPCHPLPLPELVLSARTLARQMRSGPHGNNRAGDGHEFWQFRPHQPGEPASLIDWKQSARSPDPSLLWVREQEQQAPRPLYLWVDPSASMHWRSTAALPTKQDTALQDGLALAQAALQGGEDVGIPSLRSRFSGNQALPRLAHSLMQLPARDTTGQDATFPGLAGVPPHAALVVVSDFLWKDTIMHQTLAQLATRPGRTVLLAVLDPQEKQLPFGGSVHFISCEHETPLTLPAMESLHGAYEDRLAAHFAPLTTTRQGHPLLFRFHVTSQPALPVLTECHQFLRGRT